MKKSKGFSCWDAMHLMGIFLLGLDVFYLAFSTSPKSPIHFHLWIVTALIVLGYIFLFFSPKEIE